MRIKAMDDRFRDNAKLIRNITMTLSLLLYIGLVLFFLWHLKNAPDELNLLLYALIIYTVIITPITISMVTAMSYIGTIKVISKNRWVTYGADTILLEDTMFGEKVSRTYAWADIVRITVCNVAPFTKLRKIKTRAVRFIFDEDDYARYKFSRKKNAGVLYLDAVFAVMKNDDVMDAIAQHWDGEVETDGRFI